MENGQNETAKPLPGKKELKKQLADKMETALPELRQMLGDKKFANRIKKAAKLLMEGLHKEDLTENKKQSIKQATPKKTATKKAAEKKASTKKATTKTAKAAPAGKAKAAKKVGAGK